MAGLVSVGFSMVLSAPITSVKEIFCRKATLAGLSSQATGVTDDFPCLSTDLLASCGSNKGKYSANRRETAENYCDSVRDKDAYRTYMA